MFRVFVKIVKRRQIFRRARSGREMNVEILFAREYFFLSPFSPPLSLIFWSTRHRYHPFAKAFSMKEYQHYHGDTLISEVPHSWRNTSIKVSQPPPLKPSSCLLQNALSHAHQRPLLLSTMQPAWFCFWPRKIFHRMHTSFALIGFAKSSLLPFVQPLCRVFLAKKKERRKKKGRFSKCNVKRFPLNFREISFGRNISFGNAVDELDVWLPRLSYISQRAEGETFKNGRVYTIITRIAHQIKFLTMFICYNNCSLIYNLISYTFFFFLLILLKKSFARE